MKSLFKSLKKALTKLAMLAVATTAANPEILNTPIESGKESLPTILFFGAIITALDWFKHRKSDG